MWIVIGSYRQKKLDRWCGWDEEPWGGREGVGRGENKQSKTNKSNFKCGFQVQTQTHTQNTTHTHTHSVFPEWQVAEPEEAKRGRSIKDGGARWSVPLVSAHNQTKTLSQLLIRSLLPSSGSVPEWKVQETVLLLISHPVPSDAYRDSSPLSHASYEEFCSLESNNPREFYPLKRYVVPRMTVFLDCIFVIGEITLR